MKMFRELFSTIRNLPKHLKSAFQGVVRNGAMSISSMVAVTITLILVSVVMLVALNVQSVTQNIENNLTIYVQLKRDVTDERMAEIETMIKAIPEVEQVVFSSKEDELKAIIKEFDDADNVFSDFLNGDNPLGNVFIVSVRDSEDIAYVQQLITNEYGVNKAKYGGDSTLTMISTFESIRNGGFIFAGALSLLAIFMISNTIKLTIVARKTEIEIMRLVGASNAFIRVPFMLEGILIGVFGSVIPIAASIFGYQKAFEASGGVLGSDLLKLVPPVPFIYQLSLLLLAIGVGVGLIGSFLSVNRFLKK